MQWESIYQLPKEYKAHNGNTLVPHKYDRNPQLGRWVDKQRHRYTMKQLLNNCFLCLESIGFMFQSLLEYKAQHGNTLVPHKHDKNSQLGRWVNKQNIDITTVVEEPCFVFGIYWICMVVEETGAMGIDLPIALRIQNPTWQHTGSSKIRQ